MLLLGCADPTADVPTDLTPGVYTGPFSLDLTASFGLWESEPEGCTADLTLVIDPEHESAPIRGRVFCETPSLGVHLLDIRGELTGFPEVTGDLTTPERSDRWTGLFLDETLLAADLTGAVEQSGVTVAYTGTFLVRLDPHATSPGSAEP